MADTDSSAGHIAHYRALRTFDSPDHTFSRGTTFLGTHTGAGFWRLWTADGRWVTLSLAVHQAHGTISAAIYGLPAWASN